MEQLEKVFGARSVAVVGASRDETKRGFQAIKVLLDEKYEGKIYPVNPREMSILGLKCYRSVLDIEDFIDIVLITTPAKTIPVVVEECGRKGAAGVVIIADGFGETGDRGKKFEGEITLGMKNNHKIIQIQ